MSYLDQPKESHPLTERNGTSKGGFSLASLDVVGVMVAVSMMLGPLVAMVIYRGTY